VKRASAMHSAVPRAADSPTRPPSLGLGAASVLALTAIVWALHRLGHGRLSAPPLLAPDQLQEWADQRDAIVIAFALARVLGLAFAGYLLVVSVLGMTARALRSARLLRWVDLVTLPVARRLLGTVAGLSLSTATAAVAVMPAATSRPGPVAAPTVAMHRLPDGTGVTMRRLPDGGPGGPDTGDPRATMRVADEPPAAATMRIDAPPPETWVVQPGDSLWGAARRTLAATWGREPSDAEVDPYWRAVVDANRARLVDPTNPDLIYPGQELVLPTAPADPDPADASPPTGP